MTDKSKNILITIISTIIATIIYLAIYACFLAIPIIGYNKMKDIPENENDYSEWTIFYLVQLIVNAIYALTPIFTMVVSCCSKKISTAFGSLVYGLQTLVYLGVGIAGIVLYVNGKDKNVFGNEWKSDTLNVVENNYKCCFAQDGYARSECQCHIDPEYNTTELFGNVSYNITDIYEGSEEVAPVGGAYRKCGECSEKFFNLNDGFLITCIVLDFVICCCCGGSTTKTASQKEENDTDDEKSVLVA